MMPYVICLTGASRCGKSNVIDILFKISQSSEKYSSFLPILIPKYTTRKFRENEIARIKAGQSSQLDIRPVIGDYNEVSGVSEARLKEIKMNAFKAKKCDLAYEQYGDRYGLQLSELYSHIKKGETSIVILNDVRTVEDIKTALGRQCISFFIFRDVPNYANFQAEGRRRHETEEEIKARFEKAEAIYRIYIENIHIFDKLLLNIQNDYDELEKILKQLITHLCTSTPVFV